MSFKFQPATRQGIKPLIGLYGESNSGKTFSALLLARGFAGPNGKVILGDTESGRGALYADLVPGGYLRADIEPPFSPAKFIEFLDAAEKEGAAAIVIDSLSHEHEGAGGILDMAMENEHKSGRAGLHNWKTPKMEHAKLVLRLLRSKTFVIVCLRAKFKTRQGKENGKTVIVKDDHVSPIADEALLFEMTAHAEMQSGNPGTIRLTKWSVPDLAECFPKDGKDKISVKTGEAIRAWAGGGKQFPAQVPNTSNGSGGGDVLHTPEPESLSLTAPSDALSAFLEEIAESTEGAELAKCATDYKKLADSADRSEARAAIADRAKQLGLTWSKEHSTFISDE